MRLTDFGRAGAAVLAALALAPAAEARSKVVSGEANGFSFEARNLIVGMTSTATAAAGGNPIYFANAPVYRGVVTLIMEYSGIGAFICTGSAVAANKIVTAAHCVSDGFGTAGPDRVRAYFTASADPDLIRYTFPNFNPAPGVTAIDVAQIWVNPGYTGQVVDHNDIAVLRLAAPIPGYAPIYDFYWDDPVGKEFNVVGNGGRSTVGGAIGVNAGVGRMRQGNNIFDWTWGDPVFGGFFTAGFWGTANYAFSLVSDFDSGLAANDVGGALDGFFPSSFAQLGVGALEVSVAGGDSGGPNFIGGKIAGITSYGAKFSFPNTDVDTALNSSWGEMNGFVPIWIHRNWLLSVVPEPSTWAMLIAGFGMVGAAVRRRRATVAA